MFLRDIFHIMIISLIKELNQYDCNNHATIIIWFSNIFLGNPKVYNLLRRKMFTYVKKNYGYFNHILR